MRDAIEEYIVRTLSTDVRLNEGLPRSVFVEAGMPQERPDRQLQVWVHEGPSTNFEQDYIEGGDDVSVQGITEWSVSCRVMLVGPVEDLYAVLRTLTRNVFRVLRDLVEAPSDETDPAYPYWGYAQVNGFGQPYALMRSANGARVLMGVQQEIAYQVRWVGTWEIGD